MSSRCGVCGSTRFDAIDGFFYCAVCSSQSQVHREFDMEDNSGVPDVSLLRATALKKNTKNGPDSEKTKKPTVEVSEEVRLDYATVEGVDYPAELGRPGLRLSTFATLLRRFCVILIRDHNVPPTITDHAQTILQHYLKHFGIAFCKSELAVDNPHVCLLRNPQYEVQLAEAKKRTMEREEEAHSRGNIFSRLFGSSGDAADTTLSLPEKKGLQTDTEEEVPLVISKETKLSRQAVYFLSKLPLYDEILLVILYMAALSAGAKWILLSDIARWFREGRLRVSRLHLLALIPLTYFDGKEQYRIMLDGSSAAPSVFPLHEYIRTVFAVAQMTGLPSQPLEIDFLQIISRLVFNLNLPRSFLHNVHVLYSLFPPSLGFSASTGAKFFNFDGDVMLRADQRHTLFKNRVAIACDSQAAFQKRYTVLPSTEVKAMALILFALKLVFGLDDSREYSLKSAEPENANTKTFDFHTWIHQLKMRENVWKGRTLKNVLEKRSKAIPTYFTRESLQVVSKKVRITAKGFHLRDPRAFKGCVPNYVICQDREYALYNVFADDLEPRPAKNLHDEALLAPLRFQSTRNKDWYRDYLNSVTADGESNVHTIDKYNAEVFFKSFDECSVKYEENFGDFDGDATLSAEGGCDSVDEKLQWRRLFPCSSNYVSYPRPVYIYDLVRRNESLYIPEIYAAAVQNIYRNARTAFSESFSYLLELFALVIGETPAVLYGFFLMVEMRCLIPDTLQSLEELTKEGDSFTTCALLKHQDVGELVDVTLERIPEDVPPAAFRYQISFGQFYRESSGDGVTLNSLFATEFEAPRRQLKRRAGERARRRMQRMSDIPRRRRRRLGSEVGAGASLPDGDSPRSATPRSPSPATNDDQCETLTAQMDFLELGRDVLVCEESDEENGDESVCKIASGEIMWANLRRSVNERFAKDLAFEFETAFALTICKYW